MSKLNEHNEVVGRTLVYLLGFGLGKTRLKAGDVENTVKDNGGTLDEMTFCEIVDWMEYEGLIRWTQKSGAIGRAPSYLGVQLTSAGVAALQEKNQKWGASVEEYTEREEGKLTSDKYAEIGSFVGGLIGGVTKVFTGS